MIEQAKAWRSPVLTDLEVLHAKYRTHTFPRHVHEEFCVGIIVDGVEAVKYRGATHIAPQGSIVVLHPGEGHSNWAAGDEGWSFKVVYPSIQVLQECVAGEKASGSLPFFANPIVCDRALFRQFKRCHAQLGQSCIRDRLAIESLLLATLQTLVVRHAAHGERKELHHHADHRVVQLIKDYLQLHYCQDPSLEDLSRLCGLSPFHLTRLFCKSVGLPPHAYLTHLRITQAKLRLRHKESLTQLALDLGFTDQSHFTKTFKAWVGVTPGQYRLQM